LKLPEVIKVILKNYTLGGNFCRQSLLKGVFFKKTGEKFKQVDVTCHCSEQTIVCYALQLGFILSNIHRSGHINCTSQLKFRKGFWYMELVFFLKYRTFCLQGACSGTRNLFLPRKWYEFIA
jgi:hypothetical protein